MHFFAGCMTSGRVYCQDGMADRDQDLTGNMHACHAAAADVTQS
jgi:hypothetical protein